MSISYVRQMPDEPIFVLGFEGLLDRDSLYEGINQAKREGYHFDALYLIVDTRDTLSSFADVQATLNDALLDLHYEGVDVQFAVVSSVQMIKTRRYLHAIGNEIADVEFAQFSNIPNALSAVRAEIGRSVLSQ